MLERFTLGLLGLCATAPFHLAHAGTPGELIGNGDFETGSVSGWQFAPSGNSAFNATSFQPNNGGWCGEIFNALPNSLAVIKQANLGIGVVQPGDSITISFSIRVQGTDSQALAELVSETSGGVPSVVEVLGGGPLPIPAWDISWQQFSFTTAAGPDVSAGISLQITADTGFDPNSFVSVWVDDVSAKLAGGVAAPGSAYCFGDATGAACPCSAFGAIGEGCANTGGIGASMSAVGTASFGFDTFRLDVVGVPGAKPGLILRGDNQTAIPAGDGILCTTGGSQRSQVQVTAAGVTSFTDFRGADFGTVANLGAPTNFQFWYRDASNPCSGAGFNFTNGWTVTYQP